jgi:hypothetical protein
VNNFRGLKPRDYWTAYLLSTDKLRLFDFIDLKPEIRNQYLLNKTKLLDTESCESYVRRIKKILPNFPKHAIATWLFQHNHQVEEIIEQPIENFIFKKSYLSLKSISDYSPQLKSPVDLNLIQLSDQSYQRQMLDPEFPMSRIREYLKEKKVWPGRPIIMDTSNNLDDYLVKGYPLNKPFDVLEGFRRFSVIKFYLGEMEMKESLRIYRVLLNVS